MGHVADILEGKGREVLTIDGAATVYDAIAKMVDGNVGALLVNEDGRLAGIVTERDYLRRVTLAGTRRADDAGPRDHDLRARLRRSGRVDRRVHGGDDGAPDPTSARAVGRVARCVGIVSIGDVVKFQSKEQSVQIRFLTEYISG